METQVLSDVVEAFSREPGMPKTYVQDAIGKNKDKFKTLLSHPGVLTLVHRMAGCHNKWMLSKEVHI